MQVTDKWIGGGFQGLFFDKKIGYEYPSVNAPVMPLKNPDHDEKLQFELSSFTINSFFSSLTEVADVAFWARDTGVTCSSLNKLLPGISDYYGAD